MRLNNKNFREIFFKIDADNINDLKNEILNIFKINNISSSYYFRTWFNLPINKHRNISGYVKNPFEAPSINQLTGIVQFLHFSKIDGLPLFFAYQTPVDFSGIQPNMDVNNNTLGLTENIIIGFSSKLESNKIIDSNYQIGNLNNVKVLLASLLESDYPNDTFNLKNRSDRIENLLED